MKSPESRLQHPMPCPGCRRIIDARERFCPYCGIDTDAKLWPLRAALPLVAVALVLVVGWLLQAGYLVYAVLLGIEVGLAVALWREWRKRQ